ncbi:MAG: hypothetical protein R3F59_22805 [Myxococcota bacterium]
MARLRMFVQPEAVRIVLPSRLGQLCVALSTLFFGLGVVPAAATVLVGWAWAVPWSMLALVAAQPTIASLRQLARPRVDVEIGLRRLLVRRSFFGLRGEGWSAPWDELEAAHLCGRRTADAVLELVVVDHRGVWSSTGVRGTLPELAPLLRWVREQIASRRGALAGRDGSADLRQLAGVLSQARSGQARAAR